MNQDARVRLSEKLCAETKKRKNSAELVRDSSLIIPKKTPYVLCLGDSFTYGHGVDPQQAFPYLLGQKTDQFLVVNGGVQGASAEDMLTSYKAFGERSNAKIVFLVVMDIILMRPHAPRGVNNQDDGIDLQNYNKKIESNLQHFREIILTCNKLDTEVVLVYWPRHPFRLKTQRLKSILEIFCHDEGIHLIGDLIDYLSVYDEKSLILCATDWHPSIKAHQIVANVLWDYFEAKIEHLNDEEC